MNSTQQQCFMLAVKHNNFTRAAESLYITQPALSRNISALEEELELLLFTRNNNVVSITPGGQMLYDWLCRTGPDFEAMLEQARKANAEPKQALRVCFVKTEIPPQFVADAVKRLRQEYPELDLNIYHYHSKEVLARLEDHSVDVALLVGSAIHGKARLLTQPVSNVRRCIAVAISHPLAARGHVSLEELRSETFISVKPDAFPSMTPMVQRVCANAGFRPRIIEAEWLESQIGMIESGRGVGLVVENHVEQHNPLIAFLTLDDDLPVEFVCAWDRLNPNPHIEKFVNAVRCD